MPTVNELLQDKAILDQTYLDKYGNQLVGQSQKILRAAQNEIRGAIANMTSDAGVLLGSPVADSVALHKKIRETTSRLLNKYNRQIAKLATGEMAQLAGTTQSNVIASLQTAMGPENMALIGGSGFKFNTTGQKALYKKLVDAPISFGPGQPVFTSTEAMQRNLANNTVALRDTFNAAKYSGQSYDDLISQFNQKAGGVWGARFNAVDTTLKTIMSHVSSAARQVTYADNRDVIYGYQWVSTLDKRTSVTCMDNDGRIYCYEEEDYTKYHVYRRLDGAQYPPAHYRCRSTTVPLTRRWDDLGVDGMQDAPQGTRASMNGQVPAGHTYSKWFNGQTAGIQKDILGPARYKLFAAGTPPNLPQYWSPDGRWLTMAELQTKYGLVPTAAAQQSASLAANPVPTALKKPVVAPKTTPAPKKPATPKPVHAKGEVVDDIYALQPATLKTNLTNVQIRHVEDYTGSSYGQYNQNALVGKIDKSLLEAVDKLPTYNGYTYRGYRNVPDISKWKDKFTSGEWPEFQINSWGSSTVSPTVAYDWASMGTNNRGVMLRIAPPKGVNVSGYVDGRSSFPSELEQIIAPGSKYRVTGYANAPGGGLVLDIEEVIGKIPATQPPIPLKPSILEETKAAGQQLSKLGIQTGKNPNAPKPPSSSGNSSYDIF